MREKEQQMNSDVYSYLDGQIRYFRAMGYNNPNAVGPALRPSAPPKPAAPTAKNIAMTKALGLWREGATEKDYIAYYEAEMVKYRAEMVKFKATVKAWEAVNGDKWPR